MGTRINSLIVARLVRSTNHRVLQIHAPKVSELGFSVTEASELGFSVTEASED